MRERFIRPGGRGFFAACVRCDKCYPSTYLWADVARKAFTFVCDKCKGVLENEDQTD
jgi:hypothetical protein